MGETLDALIMRAAPKARKAVKWNSPFYGAANSDTWFVSYHCFAKYIKVTFFDGAALEPPPHVTSKYERVRYFHIGEDGAFDEKQFTRWIKQAAKLPGEKL